MPQPTPYEPSYAFIELVSWPGDKLDIELENIKLTLDEALVNLAKIQRDDGELVNGIVTLDSLAAEVLAAMASSTWTVKGAWVTATAYAKLDFVSEDGGSYLCAEAHTSGTFSTDVTAGKWIPIFVPTDTSIADGEITNAKLADMAQATFKGRAAAAGTGVPVDLTATQARTILNVADGANAYVHPNHSGDVTSTADGATVIANDAVTLAKMEHGTHGGLLVYGAAGAPARLGVGVSGQFLKTQGADALPVWADLPIRKFTSADQTITAVGALALAHGLPGVPQLLQAALVCQSTSNGYTAGDVVFVNSHTQNNDTESRGISVVPDATNLNVRYGSGANVFTIINKGTGTIEALTIANWKLRLTAVYFG